MPSQANPLMLHVLKPWTQLWSCYLTVHLVDGVTWKISTAHLGGCTAGVVLLLCVGV